MNDANKTRMVAISEKDCEYIERVWAESGGTAGRVHDAVIDARPPEADRG